MATATEVGRVDERGTGGIQLRHEGIGRVREEGAVRDARRWLEGSRCRWKIGRSGVARYVGVAGGVHGDPGAAVERVGRSTAAEISGIDQGRTRGIELSHKSIGGAAGKLRLEGSRGCRKIGRVRATRQIDV